MFYVPIGLTTIQRSLIEVLTQLHRSELLRAEASETLLDNVRLITNHPFLLVDHYMPKKLLLMETHEKLLEASDLFNKLDKLIGVLQMTQCKVLLIGSSVKELDLVEAFIMGRDLCYKRYSGTSLYEPQEIKENKLTLLLVTKQQLIPQVDFVVSLDQKLVLDWNIPVIGFISVQSPMHGILSNVKWQTSLLSSIVKRKEDHTQCYQKFFGTAFEKITPLNFISWPLNALPQFQISNQGDVVDSLYSKDDKRVKLDLDHYEYKKLLTKLTLSKIDDIKDQINEHEQKLKPLRLRATIYHAQWDQEKLNIGTKFKDSMKLKEEATANESKLERLQLELTKYSEKLESLTKESGYLTKLNNGEESLDDEALDKELNGLQIQLDSITKENNEKQEELDCLRSKYQQTTSHAAERSTLSTALKAQNSTLVKKLTDAGSKSRDSVDASEQKKHDRDLQKAKVNVQFLTRYNDQLTATVKERVGTLSIGRNGRVHRSTTQYSI